MRVDTGKQYQKVFAKSIFLLTLCLSTVSNTELSMIIDLPSNNLISAVESFNIQHSI